MKRFPCFGALLLVAAMLIALPAGAQLFRAYVSGSGNDSNPCTLPQPCRLLPAALTAVASGGEIWMLDSANYNTTEVDITKSVSILAVPGVVGSLVAPQGGLAVNVNGAGIAVSLRNLVIVPLGANGTGIAFNQGQSLTVAGCEIANMDKAIIIAANSGAALTVTDTAIRNANLNAIDIEGGAIASLDRVRITGANVGVFVGTASAAISESVISGGQIGARAIGTNGTARLTLDRTRISGSVDAISVETTLAGDVATVAVTRSVLTHNSNSGIFFLPAGSSTTTATLGDNVITGNAKGFQFSGGGTIYTRGDNTLFYNGVDVAGTGTVTTLGGT
jgi:hypothetical protein